MAKQVILGTDLGKDALKVKCNVNFTELYDFIGTLTSLSTEDKTNLVAAINEHEEQINDLEAEKIDRTITVGVSKDFTTIQAAINSIKKHIKSNITIQVDAGTYNENVLIAGFYGDGTIILKGATALSNTHNVNQFIIKNCGNVSIIGFKVISVGYHCMQISSTINLYMQYIKVDAVSTTYDGFRVLNTLATLVNCQVSNRNSALYAEQLSTVSSRDWTAGSGNTVGITSNFGSTVAKSGVQPQGTTAEAVYNGGAIR